MGELECLIEGVWRDCIIYEVPIMSISRSEGMAGLIPRDLITRLLVSEAYFKFVDTDWDLNDVVGVLDLSCPSF